MSLLPHTVAYWDQPTQVIWVQTPRRRLQGSDYYFVGETTYGGWNDPANYHLYEGRQSVAYRLDENGDEHTADFLVPKGAAIYVGYMLTTAQAEFVGLL